MRDLNDKVTTDSLTAVEWNDVPSELQNVIEALSITLSAGDLNQLGKAIAGYVANGDYYTDSGAADAYVLSVIGSKQAPTAYTNGMQVRFLPGNANTGAATVNVAALGVKSIRRRDGAVLLANDLLATINYSLSYDNANGWFVIEEFNGGTITGDLTLQDALGDYFLNIDSGDGVTNRASIIRLRNNGINRWDLYKDIATESGGNAGSNFRIDRIDDAGAVIGTAMTINRATGDTTFSGELTAGGESVTTSNVALKSKTIDIGDWNMDITNSVTVAHGLTLADIRKVDVSIRNDTGELYPLIVGGTATGVEGGWIGGTTLVTLTRVTSGYFDGSSSFDDTSYNRGWITIEYVG